MKKIKKFLLYADLYGFKPELLLGEHDTYKTYFGSSIGILSFILMITTVIYFGLNILDRSNPKVIFSTTNSPTPPLVNISINDFSFAVGLQNPDTYDQYIDESIYQIQASHSALKRVFYPNGTSYFAWNTTNLEMTPCDISRISPTYRTLFSTLPLSQMYCPVDTNYTLQGTFVNDEYSFIELLFSQCRNSTSSNIKCKSQNEIDYYLAGPFFQLSYTDFNIDSTNLTQPNQILIGDGYTTCSNKYFKQIHFYIKHVVLLTDIGWLMTEIQTLNFLQNSEIKEMIDFQESSSFLDYTIKLSTKIETYQRSYTKIQNLAVSIGGIIQFIMMFCYLITYVYNKTMFSQKMINSIFEFTKSNSIIEKQSDNPYGSMMLKDNYTNKSIKGESSNSKKVSVKNQQMFSDSGIGLI